MDIVPGQTALVVTDPQNDFLSSDGVAWGVVGESVTENDTVKHLEMLRRAAKVPGLDGYQAALVNFRMIASRVEFTDTVVEKIRKAFDRA